MPKCDFIEITLWHGCSPVNLVHIFSIPFPKNTSRGLLLYLAYDYHFTCSKKLYFRLNKMAWIIVLEVHCLFNILRVFIYLNLCIGRVVGESIPLMNIWLELDI